MSSSMTPNSYAYIAIKAGGGRTVGVRQAGSPPALSASLRSENLLLLRSWQLPAWLAREDDVKLKDQANLNDQLAQLLGRGVSLVDALEVAQSTVRAPVAARIHRVRDLVGGGSAFSDACQSVGGFDPITVAVYRGAERTGDLAGAAKQLATTARRQLAVSGKAVTLLIYPAIVLSISLIVATGMMIGVVPLIGENLSQFGTDIPWISQRIFDAGIWMRANVSILAVALAAVLILVLVGRAIVLRGVGVAMRKLPLIRDVVLAQESARFFSVMAAMTRSGVPIADALGVANSAIGHPELRSQLERMRDRLISGGLLRNLLEDVEALPLATRRLLIAAERSGDLEHAFSTLAEDMTDEVDKRSQRLLAAMEPLLTVVMFVIIGSFLSAILLPILTMSTNVQQ